jgi:2-polyprenyl-6-methoxyphenol hydroxylase-like FAD-dependent oxidoreductase
MAMAGAYVLAEKLAQHGDPSAAFSAYQDFLKPHVEKRRKDAARFAGIFLPSHRSHPWLRRLVLRAIFSRALIRLVLGGFGSKSILQQ